MTDLMTKNKGLQISEGDFVTVSNIEEIKQHVIVALNTFKRDWILNRQKGIDYAGGFRNSYFLEKDIRQQILGVNNVKSLDNFSMGFDKQTLAITVTATIKTNFGDLYINETLETQL